MLTIVFFGSPGFAVPALKTLIAAEDLRLVAVVTQPDKPAGRGNRLTAPPVKETAAAAAIEIAQPKGVRKPGFAHWCTSFAPDLFVVVAYGKILPVNLLQIPRFGCINLHSSLLPKYRGAAPINWALVEGETQSGVTTMLMDEGMDTGPILLQQSLAIEPGETAGRLTERLAQIGAPLLLRTVRELAEGKLSPRAQDDDAATYAPLMNREDGVVDWILPAQRIFNRWRGFTPWPGLHSFLRGEPFKLLKLALSAETVAASPGSLIVQKRSLLVVCGDGRMLEILEAQLPGKRAVSGADLVNGLRLHNGEKLEQ